MRYVRDKLIDPQAVDIAGVVDEAAPSLGMVTAASRQAARVPDHPVEDAALEALLADHAPSKSIEDLQARFDKACTEVEQRVQAVEARAVPSAVLCRKSGKGHKVANSHATFCGWNWTAGAPIQDGWEGPWCKSCAAKADRMQGGR